VSHQSSTALVVPGERNEVDKNLPTSRLREKATTKRPYHCPLDRVHVFPSSKKVGRVGEGTYGVVYKAENREKPGDFVALKRCIPHHEATDGFPLTALREINSLRLLQHHPHVISLRTDIGMVAVSKNDVFLVFEYCEHEIAQILDHHYQKHQQHKHHHHQHSSSHHKSLYTSPSFGNHSMWRAFQEPHVKTLMKQLLSALDCMHSHRLIHRDLKMSNLLYTASGNLKLADFGLSRALPASNKIVDDGGYHLTPNVVSLWYRPPELLLGSKTYNQSIDLWGAGCIFAELLLGYPLWSAKTEAEQIQMIFSGLGVPTAHRWPRVMEMPLVQQGTVSLQPSSIKKSAAATSNMPLLDSFSYLSSSGLLLLTHLLHYDANHDRWTAAQALESTYFSSDPLPTPPSEMPKFRSLHSK
jgi:serine/threonine protein kinase